MDYHNLKIAKIKGVTCVHNMSARLHMTYFKQDKSAYSMKQLIHLRQKILQQVFANQLSNPDTLWNSKDKASTRQQMNQ